LEVQTTFRALKRLKEHLNCENIVSAMSTGFLENLWQITS